MINSLSDGGVERVLFDLIKATPYKNHIVIALFSGGKWKKQLEMIGITVFISNNNKFLSFINLFKIISEIRKTNPIVIVQSWMYVSNVFCLLYYFFNRNLKLICAIHNGSVKINVTKISTILSAFINGLLSRILKIQNIFCSYNSKIYHENYCFFNRNNIVIFNGCNNSIFNYSVKLDKHNYNKDNILGNYSSNKFIFGMVARYHPMKDHQNLLMAASILKKKIGPVFCLRLIGNEVDENNKTLVDLLISLNLQDVVLLCGSNDRIEDEYRTLSAHVLSSKSESFPNVICEAMACGIPCIATDVGDSKFIIGQTGWIVEKSNPNSLATAMQECISESFNLPKWELRCLDASDRIKNNFTLDSMAAHYLATWDSI